MDFKAKKEALKKEAGEKQNLINRSQKVMSTCLQRLSEITGEVKIIEEIENEITPKK
jgi:hypothetical protein